MLLPAVEDTGVCWYSGLTDHVGASADGVDLSRFFALNLLHFPADFTRLSNLLISLFKPEKLIIKSHYKLVIYSHVLRMNVRTVEGIWTL